LVGYKDHSDKKFTNKDLGVKMGVKDNLLAIRRAIEDVSKNVELVAVSKFHGADKIMQAIEAGQRVFGENRVQEAAAKWPEIRRKYPDIELHLIGSLQTNKADEAVAIFDVIESLDRPKLADSLASAMKKQGRRVPCLVQVNIGREPQKSGVLPEDADNFIEYCRNKGLEINGLMCIPPEGENPEGYFLQMRDIANKHKFQVLSMGMSGDFECAIKCGATHVRVGTAIFGERGAGASNSA
jgi:PLP dependent protein